MAFSSSPSSLPSSAWQSLPTTPGIYIYKNTQGKIIYVGKAKNLKNRVRSYFQPVERLGAKTAALVSQISSIEFIEVNSEVEALLLESKLIKKHKPQYNLISKDDKSPYYIHITKEKFPRPVINHNSKGALAGPFLNGLTARIILKQFRRIAPFCVANRPVNKPCFYSHLGLCNPCPGQNASPVQYKQNINKLKQLLSGHFSKVTSMLKKDMEAYSLNFEYEKAAQIRDHLKSLETLLNQPVMPDEFLINPNLVQDQRDQAVFALQQALSNEANLNISKLARIELYDIANLQGSDATAAMTVAVNGEINSKNFRHFTIKTKSTPDDVAMMTETITRRLKHLDWPQPDLIVLDGGKTQLSLLNSPEFKSLHVSVPVISLAKREEIIIVPVEEKFIEIKLALNHPGLRLLQSLRDEAHRFSRRLHHKHRKKSQIA